MNFNTHIFGGSVIILAPNYSKAYPQTAEIYILFFFLKKNKIKDHHSHNKKVGDKRITNCPFGHICDRRWSVEEEEIRQMDEIYANGSPEDKGARVDSQIRGGKELEVWWRFTGGK